MRSHRILLAMALLAAAMSVGVAQDENENQPLFDTSMYKPGVVFFETDANTDSAFITITGVVFSRAPLDRVLVGERVAVTRPAEPKDLVKLNRVPEGATDAPFRTYFELPDAGLGRPGANDIDVRAYTSDGRVSDLHRLTIIRTTSAPDPS